MKEFEFNVKFTIEAEDNQQAANILHTGLVRAMFPDEIDWQVTFVVPAKEGDVNV